ncbi:MAG: ABC transporter permease [Pirellulales bacterium]|nr:ABC transporter permease [Pirellulales bacterium]
MTDPKTAPQPRRYYPVLQLILARVREFLREPEAVFWTYVFPLVLVVALGIAFRGRSAESFRVAVQQDAPAESVVSRLNADPRFHAVLCDERDCRIQLRTGRVDLVIVAAGESQTGYEYHFDPTRTESVLARNATDDLLQRAAGRRDVVQVRDRKMDEPGGRYIDFLVPGLLGMGLMGGGLWGVGYAIVDMRIRKLLKRYLATPMRRSHFLASVLISRLAFTLPEVLLVLVFARIFFGVASEGGYLAIGLLILLGAFEFAGIGLLVASRAQTIETVSGLMNAVMLPMWIGSGIFFSTERFPEIVQPLLYLLPLTPLIHALRSVMLEGATFVALTADVLLLLAWGLATFALALRWFRWT